LGGRSRHKTSEFISPADSKTGSIYDPKKAVLTVLDGWFRVIKANEFKSFAELKTVFKSVDKVEHLYAFNLGRNKLRLISSIYFIRKV